MNIPKTLYHATYKPYINSIIKNGLNGSISPKNYEDSEDGIIYLADSVDIAVSYAETTDTVPEEYLDQIVVLEIYTEKLNHTLFSIDNNVIGGTNTYEYHGIIPISSIKIINM